MKTIAFIIAFGPEARLFLHSGLSEAVNRSLSTIIFSFNTQSKIFSDPRNYEKTLQMPFVEEKPILQRMRWYANQSAIHYWSRRDGFQKWKQHIPASGLIADKNRGRLKGLLFSANPIQYLLNGAEKYFGRIYGTAQECRIQLEQIDPSLLIVSSYSARTLSAIQTACNMGIKTCLLFNSWKDLYTRPHVPDLFDLFIVWNEQMKKHLIRCNPYIKDNMVKQAFPLHFAYLCEKPDWSEAQFRKIIGADKERPLIVYTAASPMAAPHEEAVVQDIIEAIKDFRNEKKPQIIVRLNPMEIHAPRFSDIQKSYPDDIILNAPRWEWDPEHDWCCALREDLDLMNALIHYTDLHISLPSTMTFEFALADKPMINIAYDPVPPRNAEFSLKRFWNADFYEEIKRSGAVRSADTFNSLGTFIEQYLTNPSLHSENRKHLVNTMLGLRNGDPVSEMASIIRSITFN
jgi:hypothetical protein